MEYWLGKGISGGACWPKEKTTIKFAGYDFILYPATINTEQSIHVEIAGKMSAIEGWTLMNRFLSVLSWCDDQGMELIEGVGASNVIPAPIPRMSRIIGSSFVFLFNRDIPEDQKVRLALALYREGLIVNSVPFSFLSYFKILNIFWNDKFFKDKNELIEGIRSMIPEIKDKLALERLKKLSETESDIPKYLYESGRCAIAHAYSNPIIDPDDEAHLVRLSWDILIIKDIAAYLIEHKLGVSRSLL